jgi:hypothetical protein
LGHDLVPSVVVYRKARRVTRGAAYANRWAAPVSSCIVTGGEVGARNRKKEKIMEHNPATQFMSQGYV